MNQKRSNLYRAQHQAEHWAQRGQGLVEYVLILSMVAIVVIGAAFLIGLAVQRVYGIIGGALGAKHDEVAGVVITIDEASCYVVSAAVAPPTGRTGLYVTGTTNVNLADLTGSTDRAVGGPLNSNAGGFKYQPLFASLPDEGLCPKSVVIQSKNGQLAFAPVQIKYMN